MELTYEHGIYFLGIIIGVGLTLIGIGFTEYIKNKKLINKLITSLYNESRANVKKANINILLSKECGYTPYVPFHTTAYDQYRLNIMIDEDSIPGISELLVTAYTSAELFNLKIYECEREKIHKSDEEGFEKIRNFMQEVCDKLDNKIKTEKL